MLREPIGRFLPKQCKLVWCFSLAQEIQPKGYVSSALMTKNWLKKVQF